MAAGTVQTILECVAVASADQSSTVDQQVCPPSGAQYFHLQQVQAYVIDPASASYIDGITVPFDYAAASGFWGTAFCGVVALYFMSRGIGTVVNFVRRA
ncbi:hypothetical protein [Burkholderia multivorans]|uniref:hypothetical protein n=1 Tax=Burkholderia multivorans TaxID=87883 RepID=UPI0020B42708|nr:hypothetical protein [Burkholderia multivorans]